MSVRQKTENVTLSDGKIIKVKRMNWMDFAKFGASVVKFGCKFKDDEELIAALKEIINSLECDEDKKGLSREETLLILAPAMDALLGALQKLLMLAPELVNELILSSTELTSEEYLDAQQDWVNPLNLMTAALAVNYDYEVKNCFGGLVNQFKNILFSSQKPK